MARGHSIAGLGHGGLAHRLGRPLRSIGTTMNEFVLNGLVKRRAAF